MNVLQIVVEIENEVTLFNRFQMEV